MCNQHLHLLPHPIRDLIRLHTRLCVLQLLRRLRSTRCLLVIRIHVIVLTHVAVHIPLITTITTISTITTITSGAFLPWHPKGFFFHQTRSRPVAPRGVSSILFLACERPTVRTTLDHIPRKQKASVRKAEMRFVFCPSLRALLAAAYRRFFR